MATGKRNDPYKNFMFLVEIDGITQAGFREVDIPETYSDVVEYREGSDAPTPRKLAGLANYENLTLRWGVTDSTELYDWRKAVEDGGIAQARKNLAIVVLDDTGQPKARWEFSQAWPVRYLAPSLNALGKETAIECLQIVHEGMKRTQ